MVSIVKFVFGLFDLKKCIEDLFEELMIVE